MYVHLVSTLDELAAHAETWDRLAAGLPFRGWAWNSSWWRHYGDDPSGRNRSAQLFVPCVFDQAGTLIGIAPWYLDSSATHGRVLRFLGSGEVCSEYSTVLCQPGQESYVTEAMAEWLSGQCRGRSGGNGSNRWDLLELTGVDAEDTVLAKLVKRLDLHGNTIHRRAGPSCWRIDLPTRWDDYLAVLSKTHRKRIRRNQRTMFETGRAVLHTVQRARELSGAMDILVDLHQRRWSSTGQPGCFASSRFNSFHRELAGHLLRAGQLRLQWLEFDRRPIAAEYQLVGDGIVFAYQSGIDPDMEEVSPGRLITMATIRQAIEQGYRAFDFLRGDEPYKQHWRAEPRDCLEIRAVADTQAAQWRHGLWLAGSGTKKLVKSGLMKLRGR